MRDYVDAVWGWDETWQRDHFAQTYVPRRHARHRARRRRAARPSGASALTRHWRKFFLRDIELIAAERNRGIGTAILRALLALAQAEGRAVELLVLKHNPAQRLYARLGFRIVADDGARFTMRAP